jgi:hypothetical protein
MPEDTILIEFNPSEEKENLLATLKEAIELSENPLKLKIKINNEHFSERLRGFVLVDIFNSINQLKRTCPLLFKKIITLDLSENKFSSKDINQLYQEASKKKIFSMFSPFITLDLSNNKIGLAGLARLAQMIEENHIKLNALSLKNNLICDGKKIELSKKISELNYLKRTLSRKDFPDVFLDGNQNIPPEILDLFSAQKRQKTYFLKNEKEIITKTTELPQNILLSKHSAKSTTSKKLFTDILFFFEKKPSPKQTPDSHHFEFNFDKNF